MAEDIVKLLSRPGSPYFLFLFCFGSRALVYPLLLCAPFSGGAKYIWVGKDLHFSTEIADYPGKGTRYLVRGVFRPVITLNLLTVLLLLPHCIISLYCKLVLKIK